MTTAMTVMKTMTKMMTMMMMMMMKVPRPGDRGQQDVESENKNCASLNWNIRNN